MIQCLVVVILLAVLPAPAWPQDGVQFRGYPQRGSTAYEQDLGMKAMHTCIDHGRKWLAAQSGAAEAVYTCASGCTLRADGSSTCKRLCEYGRKTRKCQDGTLQIPKRQSATP